MRSLVIRLFILIGLFFPLTAMAGVWTTKASLAFQRDNLATVALNGTIYALGGAPAGISVLSSVEAYDPVADTWVTKAPMQTQRYGLSASTVNGVIYAIGGTSAVDGSGPIHTMEAYDPASDTWSFNIPGTTTPLAGMPTPRWGFDTCVVDGVIYAIGGAIRNMDVDTFYGTVEAYDPVSNTWATKSPMPTPRYGMTVSVVDGLIYAIGGWGGWPELSVVEVYDPVTDTWSSTVPGNSMPLAPMPTARDDFAYGVVNGIIYAIGGDINATDYTTTPPTPCCTTVVEAYDPVANTWTTQAPMPTMRDDFDASVMGGVIYAIAGSLDGNSSVGGGVSFTTVEAYTSSGIPSPRGAAAAVGTGQASLNWAAVSGATSYNIYWSTKPGISTASGTKITGVTPPYIHDGLTAGTWYYYVVTAVTAGGESLPSDEVSAHAYSFIAQTGVPLSSTITSNGIRIVGNNTGNPVSIVGGMYSINGGVYTSTAGTVNLGDTVTVQLTSPASLSATTAFLTIGGIVVEFNVTTKTSQTIGAVSFAPATLKVGATTTVSATASSGLAVSFGSATPDVCTVTGNIVTGIAAGACTIVASQAGDANYNAAAQKTQFITTTIGVASTAGDGQATLSWMASAGATSYKVYWSTDAGFTPLSAMESLTDVMGTSAVVTGLTNGTAYYFIVTAVSAAGESAPGAAATTTILAADSAENGSSLWVAGIPWGTTNAAFHSGANSFTDSPLGSYTNNVNTSLTLAAPLDFSSAINPVLTFWHKYDLEADFDYGYVEVSTDGGAIWSAPLANYNGTLATWAQASINLSAYAGQPSVKIRFRLQSDNSKVFDGWYVDDVGINGIVQIAATPKANQTLSFGVAPTIVFGGTGAVSATSTSGLAPSFSSATPAICTVSGSTVTGVATGACIIAADQAGNTNYNAAAQVTQSIMVSAVVPNAPMIGAATGGNAQATVSFTAPSSDGGSAITAYTATSAPDGLASTCNAPCASITVNGLSNGTAYTFTVTAMNSAGTSLASAASNSVMPAAPVATVSSTAGANGSITPASQTVTQGDTTSFTITPDAGYTASASGCGGSLVGSIYTTGVITADCTVSATFTPSTIQTSLALGWNLLGNSTDAPLDVTAAFADTAKITTVWKWIPASSKWAFYAPSMTAPNLAIYAAGKNYDVLATINGGEGFWVNAKTAFTIQLPAGTTIGTSYFQDQPDTTQNKLLKGWNLITVGGNVTPSAFNQALSVTPSAQGVIPLNVTTLWAWDSGLSNWYFYAPSLEANDGLANYIASKNYLDFTANNKMLGQGVGFWVNRP